MEKGVEERMKITREHVIWGYRLFLNREPESEEVIEQKLRACTSIGELRTVFASALEFRHSLRQVEPFDTTNIVIKELPGGARLYVDLADRHIGVGVLSGTYEADERQFIENHLTSGDVAVDVGANIGFFAVVMATAVGPEGRVHAFEPLPRNSDLLEKSIRENGYEARVVLTKAAVSDVPGILELISPVATNNWGGAYLHAPGQPVPADHEVHRVPVVRLDEQPLRRPVKLIKLDVEGAELRALRGAAGILREDSPAVVAEIHQSQLLKVSKCSANDLLEEMRTHGYRCRRLSSSDADAALTHYDSEEIINVVFEKPAP